MKKFTLLLIFFLGFLPSKNRVFALPYDDNETNKLEESLSKAEIISFVDYYLPAFLENSGIDGDIIINLLNNNLKSLGKSSNIINMDLINYINVIKGVKEDYGLKIRVLNLDTYFSRALIDIIGTSNEDETFLGIKIFKTLAESIPKINMSILTLKYDYPLQEELKLGAMLDINTNFNFLLVHLAAIFDFNYSVGSWIEYNPKILSIKFNDFNMENSFKSGLFFTQKFYEFDFLGGNILYNNENKKGPERKITSKNKFYDTYNTMLFMKWDFTISFNEDSIYSYFVNSLNISNTVKLTNYNFNFKNPYFNGSANEELGYLGNHNYTVIDNNFKLAFDKTFNFGRHFSIGIPFGFNINLNMYGSHNNMFKDITGGGFVDSDKVFEPFVGLNIGIFGKSLNFEYNRNGYKLRFISRF